MGVLEFIADILVVSSAATLGIFLAGIFTSKYVYFPLLRKTREDHMEMIDTEREERENELDTAEFLELFTEEFEELEERSEDPPEEAVAKFATTLMTPVGEVTMIYDHETSAYHYYSDRRTVPVRFLDVVAQKFVIDNDCKRFYIRETEQSDDETMPCEAEVIVDSPEETYYSQFSSWFFGPQTESVEESVSDPEPESNSDPEQETGHASVFATFKKNPEIKASPSEMIEKAMNKYKYVGTLLDYIEHQEKVETESLEISFTQFKEMVKNKIE
jgi:hypothetical protein